jgi:hypothetical protein
MSLPKFFPALVMSLIGSTIGFFGGFVYEFLSMMPKPGGGANPQVASETQLVEFFRIGGPRWAGMFIGTVALFLFWQVFVKLTATNGNSSDDDALPAIEPQ